MPLVTVEMGQTELLFEASVLSVSDRNGRTNGVFALSIQKGKHIDVALARRAQTVTQNLHSKPSAGHPPKVN